MRRLLETTKRTRVHWRQHMPKIQHIRTLIPPPLMGHYSLLSILSLWVDPTRLWNLLLHKHLLPLHHIVSLIPIQCKERTLYLDSMSCESFAGSIVTMAIYCPLSTAPYSSPSRGAITCHICAHLSLFGAPQVTAAATTRHHYCGICDVAGTNTLCLSLFRLF
ncbi:hypothetical protein DFJ77DRAFT_154750 [Powellomyces hirtus]|nr:hypothetical protein DFJ77DRAFT_154750 [Powellomyces hirtus]